MYPLHPFIALTFLYIYIAYGAAVPARPVQISPLSGDTTDAPNPAAMQILSGIKFIAGLFWVTTSGVAYRRCAATIITDSVLVTSAACVNSDDVAARHGAGSWLVVTGSDDRYMQNISGNLVGTRLGHIDINTDTNMAIIKLQVPLDVDKKNVSTISVSSKVPVPDGTSLTMFNTTDTTRGPRLILTQGNDVACKSAIGDYVSRHLMCTQPVENQYVYADALGGDPIIAYAKSKIKGEMAKVTLAGITGMYYTGKQSTLSGTENDPAAYRFHSILGYHIDHIVEVAGVDASSIVDDGELALL